MSDVIYYKQYGSNLYFLEFSMPHNIFSYEKTSANYVRFGSASMSEFNEVLIPQPTISGPYPVAIRYLNNTFCLIERPPFQISLDYSPTRSSVKRRKVKPVKIWIPWTTVLINHESMSLSDIKIYFSSKPLQSLEDKVMQPYLPNLFGDGKICLGPGSTNRYHEIFGQDYSIEKLYNFFMNEYFSGGWNADIIPSSYYKILSTNHHTDYFKMTENKNKFKFYTSSHVSFDFANFLYHLSFLSLDETLSVLENATTNSDSHVVFPLSNILTSNSYNTSFSHPSSFYSTHYSKVTIDFINTCYNRETYMSHSSEDRTAYIDSCIEIFKKTISENIDHLIDNVYQNIVVEDNNSINLELIMQQSPTSIESYPYAQY